MVQLQHMDARLDTFSIELYQVNVRVSRIARRWATMGGYASEASPPPPLPVASESDDDDDDGDDDDVSNDDDGKMLALLMRCLLDTLTLCHS